jgi:hypothetical protein
VDWLQFISTMFGHLVVLAWPTAFVVVAYLYRERLMELLPGLRLKRGEWEASFRLGKAEEAAAGLPPPVIVVAPEEQPTQEEKDRFDELAKLSPEAAVMELRRELEDLVINTAMPLAGSAVSKGLTMLTATRILRSEGVINTQISQILDDLRNVGNTAAHVAGKAKLSYNDAVRYRSLATIVMNWLKGVG